MGYLVRDDNMNKQNENYATVVFVKIYGIIGGLTGLGHGILKLCREIYPRRILDPESVHLQYCQIIC
jgi:hypothetical protein